MHIELSGLVADMPVETEGVLWLCWDDYHRSTSYVLQYISRSTFHGGRGKVPVHGESGLAITAMSIHVLAVYTNAIMSLDAA